MRYLILIVILAFPITAQAVTLLSEDYEVASINDLTGRGWTVDNTTDIDSNPVLAIVAAPSGRTGSVLRMQYAGVHVDDCCNAKITKSFTPSADVWERYYVRYDKINTGQPSGFTGITAKQHYWNVSVLPNMVTNFLFGDTAMGLTNQTNVNHTCPNSSVDMTCNLNHNLATVDMTYGQWFCVETHASQTAIDMYIDGVQTLHYQGSDWVSPATWDTMQVYRQGADNQYRYEDDFVMATTRVGCAAGGSTAGGGLDF